MLELSKKDNEVVDDMSFSYEYTDDFHLLVRKRVFVEIYDGALVWTFDMSNFRDLSWQS